MAFLIGGANSAADTAYSVANSCRFNAGDTPYFSRTLGTATNRKKFTISVWVKLGSLITADNNEKTIFAAGSDYSGFHLDGNSDPALAFNIDNSDGFSVVTSQVLRDMGAWYHLVAAVDTTQGTEANRVKFYINGSQVSNFDTSNYPDQNYEPDINSGVEHRIGKHTTTSGTRQWDGYMAEFVFIDGTQYAASDFGEFDEDSPTIWKPKDVSELTFGTNGAYLDFEDSGNLGDDHSTNTNDWAENNIAAADQATDTPTNNFCTLNPLDHNNVTFSEGNLKGSCGSSGTCRSTMAVNKGKWYWEFKYIDPEGFHGIRATHLGVTDNTLSVKIFGLNDPIEAHINGSQNDLTGRDNMSDNDILNFALDMDNNRFAIGQNGAWDNGSAFSGTTLNYHSITGGHYYSPQIATGSGTGRVCEVNFGSPSFSISSGNADANGYGNFEYAVPSGYFALCTKNLAEYG